MQKLVLDIRKLEKDIMPICEHLMQWRENISYNEIQAITKKTTDIVSLVLSNKGMFMELGIEINEERIFQAFQSLTTALEYRDEVLLLDGLYREILPWIQDIRKKIELVLEN